jgi:hypothetical protein
MPQERVREASWSGSEVDRKEQGICMPWGKPAAVVPKFVIPARTEVLITRLSPIFWKAYTTRRELAFERYDQRDGVCVIFREQGYLIKLEWSKVKHGREV